MSHQKWARTARAKINKLSPEQARAILAGHNARGPGIGDPAIRELTGGYSSQSIDFTVLRLLGIRAGYIKNLK